MKLTGERLVTGIPRIENMIVEELARLNFVRAHFEDKTVLDAGCGAGLGTHFLAEQGARRALGVDISLEAIHHAARDCRRDNLAFGAMDCTRLGLGDESFDMICSIELIEHLEDTDQYLAEMCRVLKPHGLYYLSTPNRKVSSHPSGEASWAFHVKELSADELREQLERYFDKVEMWGTFVQAYESHPIRKVTKSPLSRIKHYLPARLRLLVASYIRFWIKPEISFDDVVFTQEDIEGAPAFVALCSHKRPPESRPS